MLVNDKLKKMQNMSRICGRAIAYLKFEVRNRLSQTEISGAVNEQNARGCPEFCVNGF